MAGRSTSQSCRSGGRPVENRGTAGKLPAWVEVEQVSAGSFVEVVEECSETGSGSGSGKGAGSGSALQCSCRSFASRARFSGEKAQCWVAASKAANCTRLVGIRLSIGTWEVKGTGEDIITSSTGLMMLLASSGSLVRPTEGGSNTPARGFNGRTGGRGVKAAAEALSLWAVGENTSACARRGDGNRPTTSRVAAASSYSSSSALASAEAAAAASRAAASAGWFLSYHFLALSFSLVF